MAWYLNRALSTMRAEVNARWLRRDKTSDGTIGDPAHQSRESDHNPDRDGSVDAWDMDVQLNGVGKPYAADVEFVKRQFQKHPASWYWIHNDQISSRSEGWVPRSYAYAGPNRNRHVHHVHFNSREQFEDSTAPWGILEEDVDLEDVVWTAPSGHPSGVPAGRRDVRDILAALDTRTALLTNGGYIKNLIDGLGAKMNVRFDEVLAAIAADPTNNIQLTKDEVGELAGLLSERMPTADAIAEAVADELSRRLVH